MNEYETIRKNSAPGASILNLIRRYGTEADKAQLRGSGMATNKDLSKTYYRRVEKAKHENNH